MMAIMSYDEILDYINHGYEPLEDLYLLLKYKYLNNNEKYKVYLFEDTKHIDVYGGNLSEEYIPTHIAFGKIVKGRWICHRYDRNYIIKKL